MQKLILHLALAALLAATLAAQDTAAPQTATASSSQEPGAIQDNSFLVEEAYNQEDGVIQHISSFQRLSRSHDWVYSFTDEWPAYGLKHQLSITLLASHAGAYPASGAGIGDTALNYRYQLVGSGETRLAVAPRFSVLFPTGNSTVGRGAGSIALQTNIPLSVVLSKRFVTHWNAGATWAPHARNDAGDRAATVAANLGASAIWLVKPRFNVMLETVWTNNEDVVAPGKTERSQDLFISPGVRWAYNFKNGLQIVPGVAMPIGAGPTAGEKGVIFYLSFEHPFHIAKK